MIALDEDWLRAHPLPRIDPETNKNDRGRVLLVGGSNFVPGALRLTGEAALRAGAGKLQMATVAEVAVPLGLAVPEAAVIALSSGADGEIDGCAAAARLGDALKSCDTLILGPGMSAIDDEARLIEALIASLDADGSAVLDAAAIGACGNCRESVRSLGGRAVLTPHAGEMAALTGRDAEWIADNMEEVAREVARDLNLVVVLKSAQTVIAGPAGETLIYPGGGAGLATGGSGDVLAGILGGLMSRGTEPMLAAAWAVRTHGEAGRRLSARLGGPGLLARELLGEIPALLHSVGE